MLTCKGEQSLIIAGQGGEQKYTHFVHFPAERLAEIRRLCVGRGIGNLQDPVSVGCSGSHIHFEGGGGSSLPSLLLFGATTALTD